MSKINDIIINNDALNDFIKHINIEETRYLIFQNEFNYHMTLTSLETLKNINLLIDRYKKDVSVEILEGEKVLNLFGILQGLFVGIDCLYTIGKATMLNKMMININQNTSLREIKHVRNDVVGHPSYRFYSDDTIGFCLLDLDNINTTKFDYIVYTPYKGSYNITNKSVDMIEVINNYFIESNTILTQTINLFEAISSHEKMEISYLISILALRFSNNEYDFSLLNQIKTTYSNYLKINSGSNNRVLWRLNLIEYLFKLVNKNEFTTYLTFQELFKLYSLVFTFEKKLNNKLRYKFIKYEKNSQFKSLKVRISKIKRVDFNKEILHDSRHPLYSHNMDILFKEVEVTNDIKGLISWIKQMFELNDENILYLIGSELKK